MIELAEGDTMLSHRYAKLAAGLLNRRRLADEKKNLPWRTMTTWFPSDEQNIAVKQLSQSVRKK